MTAKERVLTAFARQIPDRVPINYSANAGIDRRLKEHFGLRQDDHEGLLAALAVDFRGVGVNYTGPRLHADTVGGGVRVEPTFGLRMRWVEHGSGGYWDYCDFPLRDADEETVARWPLPSPDDFDYSGIRDACRHHALQAVYVGGAGLGDVINTLGCLRGMEQALVDLATEDPAGLLLIDRIHALELEKARRMLEVAEGGYDFMWVGEDLGTQHSPLIGMEMLKKHIIPRHKPYFDLAKAYGLPVMMHSCGSSSWAYDAHIQIGLTVADTLQPEAANMSPAYLKKTFGDRLAFHGCISTGGPVAFGTVADTVRKCRETLEIMMPGGGYCFAPTHALQDNSPTENVVAMYATAREFGIYRR